MNKFHTLLILFLLYFFANLAFSTERGLRRLTIEYYDVSISNQAPSWVPGKNDFVFFSDRSDTGFIYLMNIDKSDIILSSEDIRNEERYIKTSKLLFKSQYYCTEPVFSPNGSLLAYTSLQNGNWDIWITNLKGMNKRLTDNSEWDGNPSFSPDGSKIVYASQENGSCNIWIMDNDGKNKERITNDSYWNHNPVWSPDGKFIAFSSDRPDSEHSTSSNFNIFIKNIHTDSLYQITKDKEYEDEPTWSPDGKMIAFQSNKYGNWDIFVVIVNQPSRCFQLTNNIKDDCSPQWSPDGKKILFSSNRTGNYDIWIMDAPTLDVIKKK